MSEEVSVPELPKVFGEYKSAFLQHVWNEVNKNDQNFLMIITGRSGSGKSWAAIKLAETLDPSFRVEERVVFDSRDFVRVVANKPEKGAAIVFDEIGTGVSSRNAMSRKNRAFNNVMQTFRHQNYIVIMTVPSIAFVDTQIRKMAHCLGIAKGANRTRGWTRLDTFTREFDDVRGTSRNVPFKCNTSAGRRSVSGLDLEAPTKESLQAYLVKKRTFTSLLNNESAKLLDADDKALEKQLNPGKKPSDIKELVKQDDAMVRKGRMWMRGHNKWL